MTGGGLFWRRVLGTTALVIGLTALIFIDHIPLGLAAFGGLCLGFGWEKLWGSP